MKRLIRSRKAFKISVISRYLQDSLRCIYYRNKSYELGLEKLKIINSYSNTSCLCQKDLTQEKECCPSNPILAIGSQIQKTKYMLRRKGQYES